MKCRTFTAEDQTLFAELSGDYNPLHTDAVVARRLIFGSQVVHGVHLLLWALDSWLESREEHIQLRSIKAVFRKPVRLSDKVRLSIGCGDPKRVTIEVLKAEVTMTRIEFEWTGMKDDEAGTPEDRFPEKIEPPALSGDSLEGQSGTLPLCLNHKTAARMFPNLTRRISPMQIAALLAATRLVGNRCPGLHSVFSELSLSETGVHEGDSFAFAVTEFEERFNLVVMSVMAPGLKGSIKAFVRPPPKAQDSYSNIRKLLVGNEFSGQRAVVIGGSRGLGEVTAKLLAAGGAEVKLTYHLGKLEAHRLVDEILADGGKAECCQYEVLSQQNNVGSLSSSTCRPTHLYYFATPFIVPGTPGVFSAERFTKFCDFYIRGFLDLLDALGDGGLPNIFYPSSVFVDELPLNLGEYAAAKTAGEAVCRFLQKARKDLVVYFPKLPRMDTDQTASLFPIENQDPVPIMLEQLRSFQAATVSRADGHSPSVK